MSTRQWETAVQRGKQTGVRSPSLQVWLPSRNLTSTGWLPSVGVASDVWVVLMTTVLTLARNLYGL